MMTRAEVDPRSRRRQRWSARRLFHRRGACSSIPDPTSGRLQLERMPLTILTMHY